VTPVNTDGNQNISVFGPACCRFGCRQFFLIILYIQDQTAANRAEASVVPFGLPHQQARGLGVDPE